MEQYSNNYCTEVQIGPPPPSNNRELLISNNDDYSNENVKNAKGLISKTTPLCMHQAFLYISLPSPHNYDRKILNATFYGGHKQGKTNVSFFLFLKCSPLKINSREIHIRLTSTVKWNKQEKV